MTNNPLDLLTTLRADVVAALDQAIAELAPPTIEPPENIIHKLPWNKLSPWPFPTQGKPALVEKKRWITLHHSAGERDTTSIEYWNNFHTRYKNWPHIGYHFCIAALKPGGEIGPYQTNRIGEFSWHDGRNHDTVGVCIAGDLRAGHDDAPTPVQAWCVGHLLAWFVPQLPNFRGVIVHKSIQRTACPGDVERWGESIVAAAASFGLDLEGRFNVPLPRVRFRRPLGLLTKRPQTSVYKGV